MAEITPDSIQDENLGSVRLIIAKFSSTTIADADTWTSGIAGIIPLGYWTVDASNPSTQASVGIALTESSGIFTFFPAEDAVTGTLFVLAKS